MTENRKTEPTTEEAIRQIFKSDCPVTKEEGLAQVDRLVDLFIDLIAERAEEKAAEAIEDHKLDYDHDAI